MHHHCVQCNDCSLRMKFIILNWLVLYFYLSTGRIYGEPKGKSKLNVVQQNQMGALSELVIVKSNLWSSVFWVNLPKRLRFRVKASCRSPTCTDSYTVEIRKVKGKVKREEITLITVILISFRTTKIISTIFQTFYRCGFCPCVCLRAVRKTMICCKFWHKTTKSLVFHAALDQRYHAVVKYA